MASNIHIVDSYNVSKHRFESVLATYTYEQAVEVKAHRSLFSLKMEWATHNFLYNLGVKRDRTKDCDLNFPCDQPEWLYCIIGTLVWIFIK